MKLVDALYCVFDLPSGNARPLYIVFELNPRIEQNDIATSKSHTKVRNPVVSRMSERVSKVSIHRDSSHLVPNEIKRDNAGFSTQTCLSPEEAENRNKIDTNEHRSPSKNLIKSNDEY